MNSEVRKARAKFVWIVSATCIALGVGIVVILTSGEAVAWGPPAGAAAAGSALMWMLVRVGREDGPPSAKATVVQVVSMAAIGAGLPFFSRLSATWRVSLLVFLVALLLSVLVIAVRRMRNPYSSLPERPSVTAARTPTP